MSDWTRTDFKQPSEGQLVDWIAPDGRQIDGGKKGRGQLWFLPPDYDMYVYYTPPFWRPAKGNDP